MSSFIPLPLPLLLERSQAVQDALRTLSDHGGVEERGAVFTKAEVVNGILDLCGYTADQDLAKLRLLEPSFGDGHFLVPAVARLLQSCRVRGVCSYALCATLANAVFAVELHRPSFLSTRRQLLELIQAEGADPSDAQALIERWLHNDDYLLTDIDGTFDIVVGNPPYVRQERVPSSLVKEYKRRFSTFYDRADLYILFFERSLDMLAQHGVLGFICANRWIKNKYGGPLRAKVAAEFNLDIYINMEGVDAFEDQVDAYPAVTIIRRGRGSGTKVVSGGHDGSRKIKAIFSGLRQGESIDTPSTTDTPITTIVNDLMNGRDPWLLDTPQVLVHLRTLESQLPTLEASGAKVGIGVATGCDKIYIGQDAALPVEDSRKLRLVLASDLKNNDIEWSGRYLVNPWRENGDLVDLDRYPRLSTYLMGHEARLRGRHTARQNQKRWYKTIDRVYPGLISTPKLLIPDIKGDATVVFDAGKFYPHHNLYVITSETWDLRVLQAILRSSVALMFVAAYCVRMAGGFLRFQAQYLRRIRVPEWHTINEATRSALRDAASSTDQAELDRLVFKVYGISEEAAEAISRFSAQARVTKKGNP